MNKLLCYYLTGKKINRDLSRIWIATFCFLSAFLLSNISFAQDPSLNCTSGCTSKDVQIQRAYLVQTDGTNFPANFSCTPPANVTVKLALDLTTKTPRVGVYIFAKIKNSSTDALIGTVSECFSTALATGGTTKVVFTQTVSWPCGVGIKLTDVYIAWGTGNTDFCQANSAPRCGATPSKCFMLPPGEFIPIVIPVGTPAGATQCSTVPAGTTSVFNLHNLDATILNGQSGTVSYYTDNALSNAIAPNENAYASASATIYAKIVSGGVSSAAINVTLTVNQTPSLTITDPAAVCSPNTVDITAAAVTNGSTLPTGTTLSYWTNSNGTGAVGTPSAVGSGTYYIKATTNTNPACSDIKAVVVTVHTTPDAPTATVTQPTCASATGTIEVTAPTGAGITYSINGTDYQASTTFENVSPGTYNVTSKANGCPSSATSKTVNDQPGTPDAPAANVTQPTCAVATGTIVVTAPLGAGITYSINGTDYQAGTTFENVSPGTYNVTAKANGCTSPTTSKTVNPQPPTPGAPTVCIVQPSLCGPTTGTVTITSPAPAANVSFSIDNGATWQLGNVFNNVAAGSVTGIKVKNAAPGDEGCISEAADCDDSDCESAGISSPSARLIFDNVTEETTVKAYPNPFSDRVKFLVTSSVAGRGNIEVYNMMGQKVKTIYEGFIAAGTQTFELSLPTRQISSLVYVLRIGDKKMTGKILQINQ
jgi:hypothetical protein